MMTERFLCARGVLRGCLFSVLLWLVTGSAASAQELVTPVPVDAQPLTAEPIVERMVTMNHQRSEALRGYTSTRLYHVENGKRQADLVVKMTYHWPDQKEFSTISESGSKFLRNHILKRLVKAELESMDKDNRRQKEMDPDNYEFELVGHERTPVRELYVLRVTPRFEKKFLFRGRIWVDAQDFGIVRMEGEPAKNPSWWTPKIDIQHSYKKIGEFWLPARNETVTQVRIFGQSLLVIEYEDYELTEVRPLEAASTARPSSYNSLLEK